jgi:ATP phosphoribosyltransferase regulatory subunit HisZ
VGGGGRYDTLLSRFGDARPAVGFYLDLDQIAPLAKLGDAR